MDGWNILFLSNGVLFQERTSVNDLKLSRVRGGQVTARRRVSSTPFSTSPGSNRHRTGGGLKSSEIRAERVLVLNHLKIFLRE